MSVAQWQAERQPPTRAVPALPPVPVVRGYGHLVFWPFAVIITLMGIASQDFMLGMVATVWSIAMAVMGARAPYIVFVCFYQAVMGLSGAAYMGVFHHYPGGVALTELVPAAAAMLLLTLFMITLTYCIVIRRDTPGDARLGQSRRILSLSPFHLFLVLLALFSLEWLGVPLQPSSTGGIRQLAQHTFNFRYVFFGLFIINVLRSNRRKHYILLAIISMYIALPLATTGSSGWSAIAAIALLFTAGCLVFPIVKGGARITPQVAVVGSMLAVFIVIFGLIWEGGMKYAWRTTLRDTGQMSAAASLSVFAEQTQGVLQNFDVAESLEMLSARMSSGIGFSSFVLSNVPRSIPHARGERMLSALKNLVPRILFPQKEDLGGDSWLVQKYANQNTAGNESGTSIGLGYTSELYIDFSVLGVVLGGILLGLIFALGKKLVLYFAKSPDIGNAAIGITLYTSFLNPDANLTKMVSSIVYALVMFSVFGYLLNRYLYTPYRPRLPQGPAAPQPQIA